MKDNKNPSIGCTVDTCRYHSKDCNCCSLENIEVGSCNCKPKTSDGTCCESFENKTTF